MNGSVKSKYSCATTLSHSKAPVKLSAPTCSKQEPGAYDAALILIHESAHHLGVIDEDFATKIAAQIMFVARANISSAANIPDEWVDEQSGLKFKFIGVNPWLEGQICHRKLGGSWFLPSIREKVQAAAIGRMFTQAPFRNSLITSSTDGEDGRSNHNPFPAQMIWSQRPGWYVLRVVQSGTVFEKRYSYAEYLENQFLCEVLKDERYCNGPTVCIQYQIQ